MIDDVLIVYRKKWMHNYKRAQARISMKNP